MASGFLTKILSELIASLRLKDGILLIQPTPIPTFPFTKLGKRVGKTAGYLPSPVKFNYHSSKESFLINLVNSAANSELRNSKYLG